jgi:hypothetical protein
MQKDTRKNILTQRIQKHKDNKMQIDKYFSFFFAMLGMLYFNVFFISSPYMNDKEKTINAKDNVR